MKWKLKLIISIIIIILISIGFGIYKMKYMNKLYFEDGNNNQEIGKSMEINSKNYTIEYPKIGNKIIDNQLIKIILNYQNKLPKDYYSYINYETFLAPDNNFSVVFMKTMEKNNKIVKEEIDTFNFNLSTGERLKDSYVFVGDYESVLTEYLKNYIINDEDYKDCNVSILTKDYKYKYALNNRGVKVYFNRLEMCSEDNGVFSILIPYEDIKDYININVKNKTNQINANKYTVKEKKYHKKNSLQYVIKPTNMYKKDNQNSELINTFFKGQKIKLLASNDKWSKVNYHNKIGYLKKKNLTSKKILYYGFKPLNKKLYSYNNVDVHLINDINSLSVGKIKQGEKVLQLGISENGWSEIEYKDEIAFIYTTYLTEEKVDIKKDKSRQIDTNKPVVALTFDDGPNPSSTNRILDVLEKNNAVATFFDLGTLIPEYPDVVIREEKIGCEVGSHTYDHKNLNKLSANEVKDQMIKSEEAFKKVLGHKPSLVRAPYGNANDVVKKNIPYPLINWNVDTLDWQSRNKDAILNEIHKIDDLNGKIILMHSIYETTADAVEVIVPELISKGYQLVTVSELARMKGQTLNAGELYYGF